MARRRLCPTRPGRKVPPPPPAKRLPLEHPLWARFAAWVKAGHLHPDLVIDARLFWADDGQLVWRTFLAGAHCLGGIR